MKPFSLFRFLSLAATLLLAVPSSAPAQWFQDGHPFYGSGAVGAAAQGASVAISADSTTIISGGTRDSGNVGAAWIFFRGSTTWGQQGPKLVGTGGVASSWQGLSVALSADGNTAVVGGSSSAGGAWVFTRSGSSWMQEGAKLAPNDAVGTTYFGTSVAISSDGNTAVIGGNDDNSSMGAAWVFTRSGGVWTQQGAKLVGSGTVGANQGISVALSGDGNTALVGGNTDNNAMGAAWVFTRSGGVWTQQGAKLVGSGAVGTSVYQGCSVALSGDGNTALVGGRGDDTSFGAAWVFTRSGGVWTQQGEKLVGSGAVGTSVYQGCSVALSGDGNTALIGGLGDNASAGAAWVFTRSGGVWTQQGSKFTGQLGARFGISVSLSGDGNTAVVGASSENDGEGRAYILSRGGGVVWTQQASLLGSGATTAAQQGQSLAMSPDGKYAVIGGPQDGNAVGAVWSFLRTGGTWVQQRGKYSRGGVGYKYGQSVALAGNGRTMIVGMPGYDTSAGKTELDTTRVTDPFGYWRSVDMRVTGGVTTSDLLGNGVAVSSDGGRVLVGAPGNSTTGAVWAFSKSQGPWPPGPPDGVKLNIGVGGQTIRQFGWSVAISGDGGTAIIGAPSGNSRIGGALVFVWSGTAWTVQGSALVGTGYVAGDVSQGYSVAISHDGNRVVIGGPDDHSGTGAAWVFSRSGGVWTQDGDKLAPSLSGNRFLGTSVAISGDGSTVALGAPGDNGVYVYNRVGEIWTQVGGKVTVAGVTSAKLGTAVTLSYDGSMMLVGGPTYLGNQGAAWTFRLPVEPSISSVADVPTDQGGRVRITWGRSYFDQLRETNQIVQYGVWRRIPPAGTLLRQLSRPAVPLNDSLGTLFDLVATIPAVQAPRYNVVAQTLFDSSASGPHHTRFLVTAHTSDPNRFYISAEDSGSSVDNLPPAGISGEQIAVLPTGGLSLQWNADRVDHDLKGYRIYRSPQSGFTPDEMTSLGLTTDTTYADTTAPHGVTSYYRIRAIDLHDNAGPPSTELGGIPLAVGGETEEVPKVFSLNQNYPNPFNPVTTIRYGLPRKSSVSLVVYNALGQQVDLLVQGVEEAGYHDVRFDGSRFASGVYFYRLQAGDFVRVMKLLLLR